MFHTKSVQFYNGDVLIWIPLDFHLIFLAIIDKSRGINLKNCFYNWMDCCSSLEYFEMT